jgi:hypothetical protein
VGVPAAIGSAIDRASKDLRAFNVDQQSTKSASRQITKFATRHGAHRGGTHSRAH